jgi:hypothetical protein
MAFRAMMVITAETVGQIPPGKDFLYAEVISFQDDDMISLR